MKAYGGVDVQIQIFLISALVEDGWSTSWPDRFTPGDRAAGTHWVDPRTELDNIEKRKFLTLQRREL
jgi:hypothetical protein